MPRYEQPVKFAGQHFTNPIFGEPYEHGRYITVSDELRATIVARLKAALEQP